MKVLNFSEIIDLKEAVRRQLGETVHLYDSCGAQAFSLERDDRELRNFIVKYLSAKGLRAVFSDDGLYFRIEACPDRGSIL